MFSIDVKNVEKEKKFLIKTSKKRRRRMKKVRMMNVLMRGSDQKSIET